MEQRRNILWERARGVVCWMIRECEARWQCLPEGQLSLSKQGDGSKVADVTNSISPEAHKKVKNEKRSAEVKQTKKINNPPSDTAYMFVGVQH